jgi:hypothetical protein
MLLRQTQNCSCFPVLRIIHDLDQIVCVAHIKFARISDKARLHRMLSDRQDIRSNTRDATICVQAVNSLFAVRNTYSPAGCGSAGH